MIAPAYRYEGDGTFIALPRFRAALDAEFVVGQAYILEQRQDRSAKSHAQFFAQLADAWGTLPERFDGRWPTDVHFRKYLLIKAGWCDHTQHPCASRAEAERTRVLAKRMDDYAVVVVSGNVVDVFTAKSQRFAAMDRRAFQEVKDKIFGFLDDMLRLDAGQAIEHTARAA